MSKSLTAEVVVLMGQNGRGHRRYSHPQLCMPVHLCPTFSPLPSLPSCRRACGQGCDQPPIFERQAITTTDKAGKKHYERDSVRTSLSSVSDIVCFLLRTQMQSESRGSIVSGIGPSYSSCGIRRLRPVRRNPCRLLNSYGCTYRYTRYLQ